MTGVAQTRNDKRRKTILKDHSEQNLKSVERVSCDGVLEHCDEWTGRAR
jgi:hypothetical protein